MLQSIDEGVGRIVATLEQNGQLDNTVIIFTSDNGGEDQVASNRMLRIWMPIGCQARPAPWRGSAH